MVDTAVYIKAHHSSQLFNPSPNCFHLLSPQSLQFGIFFSIILALYAKMDANTSKPNRPVAGANSNPERTTVVEQEASVQSSEESCTYSHNGGAKDENRTKASKTLFQFDAVSAKTERLMNFREARLNYRKRYIAALKSSIRHFTIVEESTTPAETTRQEEKLAWLQEGVAAVKNNNIGFAAKLRDLDHLFSDQDRRGDREDLLRTAFSASVLIPHYEMLLIDIKIADIEEEELIEGRSRRVGPEGEVDGVSGHDDSNSEPKCAIEHADDEFGPLVNDDNQTTDADEAGVGLLGTLIGFAETNPASRAREYDSR